MAQINCLRCKQPFDSALEVCPHCGDRVTSFQRTYAARLIDGKYQILDRLGVGGMGEIFKVRHIHLNELRVIKIMRPNIAADDQGLQRFLQEARTSTTIKDRNLAMLYDFAQLEDGSYYMVWEFIDGTNIQKWIATNGPVPPRLAVEIAIQALHGLDHLHQMGLIHRDISPENIMLSQDHNGKLLVKVIDFGIAKSLAEGDSGHGLTQTGMFLGKLKYASPEQAGFLKDGEHMDPRSDLYSFGIVMYEMLAGRAPFQATNPHGYILKHVTEKPAPIVETNPNAKVPSQLESIIFQSLEKSRDNRQATAAEFASALEAIRSTISPDLKYGLGEKMVTLSAAKTLSELPKYTPTGSSVTMGSAGTQQTSVGTGSNEATIVERGVVQQKTIVDRPTIGSNDPTVMEKLGVGTAAPTAAEAKWASSAEPTVLERQMARPKKKTGMIAAIATTVVLVAGIGGYVVWGPDGGTGGTGQDSTATTTVQTAGTSVESTATPPPPPGSGVLLLSANPWGDIDKIINAADRSSVLLEDEKRSTPTRIELPTGNYLVTLKGPSGEQTFAIQIQAGQPTVKKVKTGNLNYDDITKEAIP